MLRDLQPTSVSTKPTAQRLGSRNQPAGPTDCWTSWALGMFSYPGRKGQAMDLSIPGDKSLVPRKQTAGSVCIQKTLAWHDSLTENRTPKHRIRPHHDACEAFAVDTNCSLSHGHPTRHRVEHCDGTIASVYPSGCIDSFLENRRASKLHATWQKSQRFSKSFHPSVSSLRQSGCPHKSCLQSG